MSRNIVLKPLRFLFKGSGILLAAFLLLAAQSGINGVAAGENDALLAAIGKSNDPGELERILAKEYEDVAAAMDSEDQLYGDVLLRSFVNKKWLENSSLDAIKDISYPALLDGFASRSGNINPQAGAEARKRLQVLYGEAIEKLDEAALETRGPWLKPELTRRVTDQALLARIALEAWDERVGKTAVEQLRDQDLLAGIALEARDSETGLAAAGRLTGQPLLEKVAFEAKQLRIRHAAVAKLDSETSLARVALENKSNLLRLAAVRKLNGQAFLYEIALRGAGVSQLAAVDKLTGQTALGDIAAGARTSLVRELARSKLTDQAAIQAVSGRTRETDGGYYTTLAYYLYRTFWDYFFAGLGIATALSYIIFRERAKINVSGARIAATPLIFVAALAAITLPMAFYIHTETGRKAVIEAGVGAYRVSALRMLLQSACNNKELPCRIGMAIHNPSISGEPGPAKDGTDGSKPQFSGLDVLDRFFERELKGCMDSPIASLSRSEKTAPPFGTTTIVVRYGPFEGATYVSRWRTLNGSREEHIRAKGLAIAWEIFEPGKLSPFDMGSLELTPSKRPDGRGSPRDLLESDVIGQARSAFCYELGSR